MKINDVIKDNDPRHENRFLVIESFDGPNHVRARRIYPDGSRCEISKNGLKISIARIHTDGKKRRGGFSLVPYFLKPEQMKFMAFRDWFRDQVGKPIMNDHQYLKLRDDIIPSLRIQIAEAEAKIATMDTYYTAHKYALYAWNASI